LARQSPNFGREQAANRWHGIIFSDGIESDFVHFNSGIEARITLASQKGHLVT